MTIDEMIKALSEEPEFGDVWVEEEVCAAIIAALRAGQAMRESFSPIDDDDGTSWAVNIKRGDLSAAGQAWDAATTKGDV